MDTQHTRCNRVNPLLHEGCSRPVQPLETTALQRGTGLLIIPWSLVRIQAGPFLSSMVIACYSARRALLVFARDKITLVL